MCCGLSVAEIPGIHAGHPEPLPAWPRGPGTLPGAGRGGPGDPSAGAARPPPPRAVALSARLPWVQRVPGGRETSGRRTDGWDRRPGPGGERRKT